MSDLEASLRKRYPQFYKPKGCTLRRIKPKGPLKGCEKTCKFFKACVELTRREKATEERVAKELERLDKLGRESLNPVMAS